MKIKVDSQEAKRYFSVEMKISMLDNVRTHLGGIYSSHVELFGKHGWNILKSSLINFSLNFRLEFFSDI